MIERRFYDPSLLSKMTDLIKDTLGFSLVFTQKEMNQDYLTILDKSLAFDLYTPTYTTGLLAEHFAVMYSNKFMCNFGIVYKYNGVVWEALDKKHSVLNLFVDNKFYKYMVDYCNSQLDTQNNLLKLADSEVSRLPIETCIVKIGRLLNNVQSIRDNTDRKKLVDDIINHITNNTVIFNLDPYLFAFNNKIYSLKENRIVPSKYTQYISTTCGYDYTDYYPKERIQCYSDLIDTIFPDPQVRNYYLTVLATGLYGQQIEKFFVATGTGGNGKSLLNSQMMETVGDYGYKLGANVLLDEIKEGANPAIANLNRKRFVLCQEPNGNKRICTATVKEITGDKQINARQLYSGECKTNLTLTLVMECNELPQLDEVGGGVQRRLEAIPFDSRFVDKDTYDSLKDKSLLGIANTLYKTAEFQAQHRQALFMILLSHWEKFQKNGYSMPELPAPCKKITKDYMAMSDDIYPWFCETYEEGDDNTDLIYINDMLQTLKLSPLYSQMSKKDQRDLTAKKFNEKVEKNIFLREHYKPRNARFNNIQLTKPALCGFKKKPLIDTCEDGELEEEIVFDEV
jgi:P4 family phage/plasmid primase-like protien